MIHGARAELDRERDRTRLGELVSVQAEGETGVSTRLEVATSNLDPERAALEKDIGGLGQSCSLGQHLVEQEVDVRLATFVRELRRDRRAHRARSEIRRHSGSPGAVRARSRGRGHTPTWPRRSLFPLDASTRRGGRALSRDHVLRLLAWLARWREFHLRQHAAPRSSLPMNAGRTPPRDHRRSTRACGSPRVPVSPRAPARRAPRRLPGSARDSASRRPPRRGPARRGCMRSRSRRQHPARARAEELSYPSESPLVRGRG